MRVQQRYYVLGCILSALICILVEPLCKHHHLLSLDLAPATRRQAQRLFIASIHWNNEEILRSHWNAAIVALANAIGPDNIFVSIYGSQEWDNTKGALEDLDRELEKLGVPRNITTTGITHHDELSRPKQGPGWVRTPHGKEELRRIPFLSQERNRSLRPLEELTRRGEKFDKILFLNDVVFLVADVFRLLDTNNGNFAAACSLDFSKPPFIYDTFALRDSEGHAPLTLTWPYFQSKESRSAAKQHQPIPVKSCWNGIVAMPVEPFVAHTPLRFRAVKDSLAAKHLEGSECCLIHTDNPLSAQNRVFVNPHVLVGYSGEAYDAVHSLPKLLSTWRIFTGLWENRLRRWLTIPCFKEWRVHTKIKIWEWQDKQNKENGKYCIINEMQVVRPNGWGHV